MWVLRRNSRILHTLCKNLGARSCNSSETTRLTTMKNNLAKGPDLKEFIVGTTEIESLDPPDIPYLPTSVPDITKRKVFFDIYGCQMNLNDTEIVWSILKKQGFEKTDNENEADIFLVMTCSIREGAESKIWHRLDHLRGFKRRRSLSKEKHLPPVKIGILGCMAERLKQKLIEKEKSVDLVAGPDSYRDLPRLLALTENGQTAVNVLLSLDETYADIVPVSLNQDKVTAFISIMRGCDNMCTYCIVPFTRGRERSRPARSVCDEVRALAASGVREITLLGQNVNSYRDTSAPAPAAPAAPAPQSAGFRTVYRPRGGGGVRFAELLERVAAAAPDVRVRFTAAHPKDFPDEVLDVIAAHPNVCKLLHLPAQSGAGAVLDRMRRGHSPAAYRALVQRVRARVPHVALSTDMICGFCGETDEDFEETLRLMRDVDYRVAFLFIYSMREKTTAHRRYQDDVPERVKRQRHARLLQLYTSKCQQLNAADVGATQLVLVEGTVPKTGQLFGRNEYYLKVVFDQARLPAPGGGREMAPGDFVGVRVVGAKASVLHAEPLFFTTIREFYNEYSLGQSTENKAEISV